MLNNVNIVHMNRAFIIHGWGEYPADDWFPYAERELEKRGFEMQAPLMPDENGNPEIEKRVNFLKTLVKDPDERTYFIGHSIGCQTIARYLETLPEETRIGGAVFVAGWFTLKGIDEYDEEDKEVARPWLETPINFEKVRLICPRSVAIFTKDDPYVDIGNAEFYKDKLGSDIVILETGGHLDEESKTKELPELIEAMEKISS